MRNRLISKSKFARFGRPILATTLALAASASFAGAVVNVTSFMITTSGPRDPLPNGQPDPLHSPVQSYFRAADPQSFMTAAAKNAGGAFGSDTPADFFAPNWNDGGSISAQTSAAIATGNVISFTDDFTQQQTGMFNLTASAKLFPFGLPPLNPTTARAEAEQSGTFTLIDEDGNPVAGKLVFDVFYNLEVSTTEGTTPDNYTEALLAFTAVDPDEVFSDANILASYSLNPGYGSTPPLTRFTATFSLAAGETVLYVLAGSAFASAAAIPEPASLGLALFGLLAAGASCRRSLRQA